LVDAIPDIIKNNPNVVLVFNLIHSERTSQIRQIIRRQELKLKQKDKRIWIFNGFEREDLRRLLASVDCVVAPSISEGFGSVHSEVSAM
jgi:glycosyltransferase involved in cell wall biosynthesis